MTPHTRSQRERTRWDWRLCLYPFVVAGMMIYLNGAPGETVFSHRASSATASSATPPVAAPETVQGVTSKGDAYVLVRNPPCVPACRTPLVLEFTVMFHAQNTLID